jgi:hypothetical protein
MPNHEENLRFGDILKIIKLKLLLEKGWTLKMMKEMWYNLKTGKKREKEGLKEVIENG